MRIPLFSSLTERQLSSLENSFVKTKFKKNSLIFEQGKVSDYFFVILVGKARVVARDDQEREVIIATLNQGDYFGEMSLIDGKPHFASVRAIAATELLILKRESFDSCMPLPESIPHRIMMNLVYRLRAADQKIESLALSSGHERVIRFLKETAIVDDEGNLVVRNKISAGDIGKNIGASREMTSRVLKKPKDEGRIFERSDGSRLLLNI